MRRRLRAALSLTLMASSAIPLAAGAQPAEGSGLLVALETGASVPGLRPVSPALGIYAVDHASPSLRARLERDPRVAAVQLNRRMARASEQRDCAPKPSTPDGYLIPSIRAGEFPPPDPAPAIGVLDGGIDSGATEFAGKIKSPKNVVGDGSGVTDTDGHGTRVAGIALARPGNVRGVSPGSPVVPIKIFSLRGEASSESFVAGIGAALAAGVDVINVSATAPGAATTEEEDRVSDIAIGRAFSKGVLVVAPTGNEGSGDLNVPSAYSHVLSVGSTDEANHVSSFSNTGPSVDLVAPGERVTTTAPSAVCGSGYGTGTGTSFAAPAVSGAAAVLAAKRPELSATQRFEVLRRSAQDLPPTGPDERSGFGLLDVAAAIAAPAPAGDGAEVDDDVYWVSGVNRARNPLRLGSRRKKQAFRARVSAFNDPIDVYRVSLLKGDTLTVTLKGAAGSRPAIGLWSPRAKGFQISDRKTSVLVDYADRAGAAEKLVSRVGARGVYYVSIEAPHPDGPDTTYSVTLARKQKR
jgi:hypothetical protein